MRNVSQLACMRFCIGQDQLGCKHSSARTELAPFAAGGMLAALARDSYLLGWLVHDTLTPRPGWGARCDKTGHGFRYLAAAVEGHEGLNGTGLSAGLALAAAVFR